MLVHTATPILKRTKALPILRFQMTEESRIKMVLSCRHKAQESREKVPVPVRRRVFGRFID
jgi:hypothetical protein